MKLNLNLVRNQAAKLAEREKQLISLQYVTEFTAGQEKPNVGLNNKKREMTFKDH